MDRVGKKLNKNQLIMISFPVVSAVGIKNNPWI